MNHKYQINVMKDGRVILCQILCARTESDAIEHTKDGIAPWIHYDRIEVSQCHADSLD